MDIIGSIMGVDTEQGRALGKSMSSLALLVPHEHPFAPSNKFF